MQEGYLAKWQDSRSSLGDWRMGQDGRDLYWAHWRRPQCTVDSKETVGWETRAHSLLLAGPGLADKDSSSPPILEDEASWADLIEGRTADLRQSG